MLRFSNLFQIILLTGVHPQHQTGNSTETSEAQLRNKVHRGGAETRATSAHTLFSYQKLVQLLQESLYAESSDTLIYKSLDVKDMRKGLSFRKLLVLLLEDPRYLRIQINTKESIYETYCCSVQTGMYFLFLKSELHQPYYILFFETTEDTQLLYLMLYGQLRILL